MSAFHRYSRIVVLTLVLAGCGSTDTPPAATPSLEPRRDPTALPTPAGWTAAGRALTLDSIPQLRELGRLDAPEPPSTIFAYALSLDSALLAGLNNEFVLAWDLISGDQIFISERRGANAIFFGPDRQQVYTLSNEGDISVLDVLRGDVVESLGAFDEYNGVFAYDPIGGWLALGSDVGAVQIWDMSARAPITVLEWNEVPVAALGFSPDGKVLAVADRNGTIRFWDFQTSEHRYSTDLLTPVSDVAYAPSGRVLVLKSGDGVLVMDPSNGSVVASLTNEPSDGLFEFAGESDFLVLGGETTDVSIWEAAAGTLSAVLPGTMGDRISVAASPQGDMLLVSNRAATSLWNVTQIARGTVLRGNVTLPAADVLRVVWTADGLQILMFETVGPVRVFGIP